MSIGLSTSIRQPDGWKLEGGLTLPETFGTQMLANLVGDLLGDHPGSLRLRPVTTGKHNTSYAHMLMGRQRADPGR